MEFNIKEKMRFIGYYTDDDQFMRTEKKFPEEAEQLSKLLRLTFDKLLRYNGHSEEMLNAFNGNTVFILKGESGHLFGYYPKYDVARVTHVCYCKNNVHSMPSNYKAWFYPGDRLYVYKESDARAKENVGADGITEELLPETENM